MAPSALDTFIDDEEDTCPLCIEEFDLSDKSFRPCPCGYQVCQFCFNNIKNNMNGLCPACRRPYDEKTIEYKVVTAEEMAQFRANIQKNQKKRAAEQRQKEVQKREADKESRKNLVGVRVVQKNLVYVTGLTPTVREDELLKTLRKHDYFGQYGNIQKISASNRKSTDGQAPSLGIYVTFEKPEEASRCIQAVNGSQNGDRVLKAQLGTTKYCSAWLRHEPCTNRSCMFLHELGDEEDSYTRQDLSSMNGIHTQRPLPGGGTQTTTAGPSRPNRPQSTAPSVAATAAPPTPQLLPPRLSTEDTDGAPDGSALPSSANWARNPPRSRRGSAAASAVAPSPGVTFAAPAVAAAPTTATTPVEPVEEAPEPATATPSVKSESPAPPSVPVIPKFDYKWPDQFLSTSDLMKGMFVEHPGDNDLQSTLRSLRELSYQVPEYDAAELEKHPAMFDIRGGEKRRAAREQQAKHAATLEQQREQQLQQQLERASIKAPSEGEPETGGSLALGGEPEDREPSRDSNGFEIRRPGTQPPIQRGNDMFGPSLNSQQSFGATNGSIGSRTMTPQQQQLALRPGGGFADQLPPGIVPSTMSMYQQQQQQGHGRQSSRFPFGGDNSGSGQVKLAANPRSMAQQASHMQSGFQSQAGAGPFYGTTMPAPPPGLKSTGTPPAGFAQGHGFANAGFGAPKESASSTDLLNHLIRGRNGPQAHDAAKRSGLVDLADPSILLMQHQQGNASANPQSLYGGQAQQETSVPDEDLLLSLDEASRDVDALVGDIGMETAPTTTGSVDASAVFGAQIRSPAGSGIGPPPGLGIMRSPTSPPAASRLHTPVLNYGAIVRTATPARSQTATPVLPGGARSEAKETIKTLALKSGLSDDIASQSKPAAKPMALLDDEEFPALSAAATPSMATPSIFKPSTPRIASTSAAAKDKGGPFASSGTKGKGAKQTISMTLNTALAATPTIDAVKSSTTTAQSKTTTAGGDSATTPSTATDKASVDAAFPPLPTPSSAPVSATRAPKTLRVIATPKTEATAVMGSAVLAITAAAGAKTSALPTADTTGSKDQDTLAGSDSASVISASAPSMSVTASRPSSPPLGGSSGGKMRVGTAPVRALTKSQMRKQRKEAQKEQAVAVEEATVTRTFEDLPPAEEHAPIMGRKKKQKKEPTQENKVATAEASRDKSVAAKEGPASGELPSNQKGKDAAKSKAKDVKTADVPEPAAAKGSKKADGGAAAANKSTNKSQQAPAVDKTKTEASARDRAQSAAQAQTRHAPQNESGSLQVRQPTSQAESATETPAAQPRDINGGEAGPTASAAGPDQAPPAASGAVLNEPKPPTQAQRQSREMMKQLLSSTGVSDVGQLSIFKQIDWVKTSENGGHAQPQGGPARWADFTTEPPSNESIVDIITDHDRNQLAAGHAVHKEVAGQRVMLTPHGDILRNLTPREEERFLTLQKSLAAAAPHAAGFEISRREKQKSTNVAGIGGFTVLRGRALPTGPPSCMPVPTDQPVDPIARIRRQETLAYLNQMIMPHFFDPTVPAAELQTTQAAIYAQSKMGGGSASASGTPAANAAAAAATAAGGSTLPSRIGPNMEVESQIAAYMSLLDPNMVTAARSDELIPDEDDNEEMSFAEMMAGGGSASLPAAVAAATRVPAARPLSVEAARLSLEAARKETERLEKTLNGLVSRSLSAVRTAPGAQAHGPKGPMIK